MGNPDEIDETQVYEGPIDSSIPQHVDGSQDRSDEEYDDPTIEGESDE